LQDFRTAATEPRTGKPVTITRNACATGSSVIGCCHVFAYRFSPLVLSPSFQDPHQLSFTSIWDAEPSSVTFEGALVPVFRVHLAREGPHSLRDRAEVDSPGAAAEILGKYLQHADREHFVVIMLCTQNRLIGVHTVSIGTLNAALVCAREVFKAPILANAAGIIVGHNHPSGDPEPSPEDKAITHMLRRAGDLLGIPVLDHIVVGDSERFVSLKRLGIFDYPS